MQEYLKSDISRVWPVFSCIIYEVQLENGSFQIVSFEDISNLVGDEKLTQGDTNCLSDLGSTCWLKFG